MTLAIKCSPRKKKNVSHNFKVVKTLKVNHIKIFVIGLEKERELKIQVIIE